MYPVRLIGGGARTPSTESMYTKLLCSCEFLDVSQSLSPSEIYEGCRRISLRIFRIGKRPNLLVFCRGLGNSLETYIHTQVACVISRGRHKIPLGEMTGNANHLRVNRSTLMMTGSDILPYRISFLFPPRQNLID